MNYFHKLLCALLSSRIRYLVITVCKLPIPCIPASLSLSIPAFLMQEAAGKYSFWFHLFVCWTDYVVYLSECLQSQGHFHTGLCSVSCKCHIAVVVNRIFSLLWAIDLWVYFWSVILSVCSRLAGGDVRPTRHFLGTLKLSITAENSSFRGIILEPVLQIPGLKNVITFFFF